MGNFRWTTIFRLGSSNPRLQRFWRVALVGVSIIGALAGAFAVWELSGSPQPSPARAAGTPPEEGTVGAWGFHERVSYFWRAAEGLERSGSRVGLTLRTSRSAYAYQLTLTMQLQPGSYTLTMNGGVRRGGITIGVTGPDGRWITHRSYLASTDPRPRLRTAFTIHEPETVQLVLANYSHTGRDFRSIWFLREIALHELY